MRLCAIQVDSVWEDKAATHARVEAMVAQAPPPPGSLLILPEMFATGFSMAVARIAETPAPGSAGPQAIAGNAAPGNSEGSTTQFLRSLATKYSATVVAGLVGLGDRGLGCNEALAVGPDGKELARYVKLHPFSFAHENDFYQPGPGRVNLFDWAGFRVAALICYDLRFPEAFRLATRQGAQLLLVIANWPTSRIDHWTALLRARAIENQAYVAGVNRCGKDPNLEYGGQSMIFDPRGQPLAEADDRPAVISADLDLTTLLDWRHEFPALADIRPDLLPPVGTPRAI